MTVKPRTIDNLGVDSSIRYAKDQEALDTRLIQESRFIPQKTEVSVLKPSVPTEMERYFGTGKVTLWASFAPPPETLFQNKPLFTYQLIPSLGGYEKQEANTEKLESLEDVLDKSFSKKRSSGQNKDQNQERDQKEKDQEEKERQVLLALLKCIGMLDRTLTLINARRNQYQRG